MLLMSAEKGREIDAQTVRLFFLNVPDLLFGSCGLYC